MSANAWIRNGQNTTQPAFNQQPETPAQAPVLPPFNTQEVRDCLKAG